MFYFVKELDECGNKIDYSNYTEEQLKELVEPLRRWNRETIERPRIIWSRADIIAPVLEEDNTWTIYYNYKSGYDNEDDEEMYFDHEDMVEDEEFVLNGWVVVNPKHEEIKLSRVNYSEKVPDFDIYGEINDNGNLCFSLCAEYVENIKKYSAHKLREAIINNYRAIRVLEDCKDAYRSTGGFCDSDFEFSKSKIIFSVSSEETPVDPYKFLFHFDLDKSNGEDKISSCSELQEIDIKGLPFALSDAVVCFTGIRDNDLENIIKSKGGKIVSSVTKACNYLIYSSDDSVKYRQAKERNIFTELYSTAKKRFGK